MKRHVKYDNAQQGSKVRAKLPIQLSERHKSRLQREHAEQTTVRHLAQRLKVQHEHWGQQRCVVLYCC